MQVFNGISYLKKIVKNRNIKILQVIILGLIKVAIVVLILPIQEKTFQCPFYTKPHAFNFVLYLLSKKKIYKLMNGKTTERYFAPAGRANFDFIKSVSIVFDSGDPISYGIPF